MEMRITTDSSPVASRCQLSQHSALFIQYVVSEGEIEIKRGTYPYMAFIYYPDDSVVDKNGERITRAGILVKLDWLITSSLETDVPLAFPKKTLVARLGSVAVDKHFNINEDEDEQESEVIQIIRPYNFSAIEWWYYDISLLKTLVPFNVTSSVAITSISSKPTFAEKECAILVYARKNTNITEDRFLIQIPVDIVPPTLEHCGSHFRQNTMICAMDIDDKKNTSYSRNFCHGNSGGPLLCDNDVYGLQTYSEGCQEPHLYQLFSGWTDFISCGIQDICGEKQCAKVCTLINKDTEKYSQSIIPSTASGKESKSESTTVAVARSYEAEDNIILSEESSPDRPTATATKDDEITTSTVSTTKDLPVEISSNSSSTSAPDKSNDDSDTRRSNVEAQQEPVKKIKSSCTTILPLPFIQTFAFICTIMTLI
ncbi:uncharacterized protein LOC119833353 [Zerene cesonia]|uniref:uncharacterized protein LOC119833353 n=1 Tax=Zerene cesonia TaxID=33412 RepID=UPI0018E4E946|nr:uncharacterized protein LOC119833353 [Zerene cesonia]